MLTDLTLKIREATADDIPGMMSLFDSSINAPKSASFFRWWYGIPSVTYCALDGSELVGMFVVLRRTLMNGLKCGVLMGLLVKKEWRGKGLFRELGKQAMNHFEDIDLFCCLTNAKGREALEINFNFITIDTIETMALATQVTNGCCDKILSPVGPNTKFYCIERGKEATVMFRADEEFRQWRFAAHPQCAYGMIRRSSGEFVILNKYCDKETNLRYGDIADFEVEKLEESRLACLLNAARLNLGKEVDFLTIQAIPKSLLHRICQNMGFIESGLRHNFCIKVKEPANEYLYDSSRWLIKWGDYLR